MFRFRTPFVAAAVVAGLQITAAAEREISKIRHHCGLSGIRVGANTDEVHAGRTGSA